MSSVVAGFAVRKTYEGEKDFDTTYKEVELKKRLVPLGPAGEDGEIPYTEEVIEIVHETPIKDVIAAQNDSCGLEAFLKPYRIQGIEPPDVSIGDGIQDFTQFDETGDLRASGTVEKLFGSLPAEMQSEYGSPEKLLREINDAAIEDFAKKYIAEKMKKPEEVKEDKE